MRSGSNWRHARRQAGQRLCMHWLARVASFKFACGRLACAMLVHSGDCVSNQLLA